MDKNNIYKPFFKSEISLPVVSSTVQAGFPSPADDFIEKTLDLNELLIKKPAATFFVKVEGDSMIGAGIHPGDTLVVDRSITPTNKKIIIAVLNGEFTVKRFIQKNGQIVLRAENPHYNDIHVTEETDFQVWGVVTYAIRSC